MQNAVQDLLRLDVPPTGQSASQKAAKLLQTCLDVIQKGSVDPLVRFMRQRRLLWPEPSDISILDLLIEMSLHWGVPVWGAFRMDTFNRDLRGRPLLEFGETKDLDLWLQRKELMIKVLQYNQYLTSYLLMFGVAEDKINSTIMAINQADFEVEEALLQHLGHLNDQFLQLGTLADGDALVASLNHLAYWVDNKYTLHDAIRVRNEFLLNAVLRLLLPSRNRHISLSFGWNIARQLGQYSSRDLAMVQYYTFDTAEDSLRRDCFDFVRAFMAVGMGQPYVVRSATPQVVRQVTDMTELLQDTLHRRVLSSPTLTDRSRAHATYRLRSLLKVGIIT